MKQLYKNTNNFYLTILERELNIVYSDLKNVECISRIDGTLLSEVNDFLEDLRSHRRELNRKYSNLKNNSKNEEENLAQLVDHIARLDEMESQIVNILEF